jgi:hypothetical protein
MIAVLILVAVFLTGLAFIIWADIKDRKEHPGDDDSIR